MDWILEHTVHRGLAGASHGDESFSDLDYADDVALLAEMLEVLILLLEIMQERPVLLTWKSIGARQKKSRQQSTLQFPSMLRWLAIP